MLLEPLIAQSIFMELMIYDTIYFNSKKGINIDNVIFKDLTNICLLVNLQL